MQTEQPRPRKGKPFVIDTTPTWEAVLPIYLAAATEGSIEGRGNALSELRRMAKLADLYTASLKSPKPASKAA